MRQVPTAGDPYSCQRSDASCVPRPKSPNTARVVMERSFVNEDSLDVRRLGEAEAELVPVALDDAAAAV